MGLVGFGFGKDLLSGGGCTSMTGGGYRGQRGVQVFWGTSRVGMVTTGQRTSRVRVITFRRLTGTLMPNLFGLACCMGVTYRVVHFTKLGRVKRCDRYGRGRGTQGYQVFLQRGGVGNGGCHRGRCVGGRFLPLPFVLGFGWTGDNTI